jgi:tRNA threonylcarbamoyladenosine modification (KEOPS) complex  Pcc1 subunit
VRIIRSAEADVRIGFNERLPELLERSLLPEAERPTSERSSVSIASNEEVFEILIEASDVIALRAAFNSYLHWVSSILDVIDTVR